MNNQSSISKMIEQIMKTFIKQIKGMKNEDKNESVARRLYERIIEKFRLSLTVKITSVYAMKIVRILTFLSFMIISGFVIYSGYNAENQLTKTTAIVTDYMANGYTDMGRLILKLNDIENINITIFDKDKKPLFESKNVQSFYEKVSKQNQFRINGDFIIVTNKLPIYFDWKWNTNYKKYNFGFEFVINKRIKYNSTEAYIQIGSRLIKESISFIALCILLLIINFFCMINVIVSGARSARKTLKPIETMTKTVENITINALDTRLDIKGSQDELKDLARTFNKMLDRIQMSYEQQNQFVSDASHELRTPISVIQGYVNMLDRWGKNDEQILQESITAIKSEAESMKELIENLLFLARGDKNTQKVEKTDFNLQELIEEILKETRMIDQKHQLENESNPSVMINGDKGLIKEALRILMDNSIKYTPEGGRIKLDSFLKDNRVIITVEDNGSGISKEDLPYIFERFYRADKSRTKETGGTGLGLAIAKWIIIRHNGKIDVQSELSKGTIFCISLPCLHNKPLL